MRYLMLFTLGFAGACTAAPICFGPFPPGLWQRWHWLSLYGFREGPIGAVRLHPGFFWEWAWDFCGFLSLENPI